MSSCHLLELPRELRDEIYGYYLFADRGSDGAYVYNFETNKLRRADKQPIDLGLMYTCKTIAAEMYGMPMRLNTVAFRTIYSDRLRTIAGRFDKLSTHQEEEIVSLFGRAAPKMDSRKMKTVFDQFRILKAGLPDYHHRPPMDPIYNRSWPEIPSTRRQAFRKALCSFIDQNPDLVIPGRQRRAVSWGTVTDDKLVRTELHPWVIPTESELDEFLEVSPTRPPARWAQSTMWKHRDWWTTSDYVKYRFSAASAAIFFLRSKSLQTRLQLRNVLIHEDHTSVAYPACHTIGLIPFCQENPNLRITRQASLWRNLFHPTGTLWSCELLGQFEAYFFIKNIAEWMVETGALVSKGMPAGQFILMLDGDPSPAQATEIFNKVVQSSAAAQQVTVRVPNDSYFAATEPCINQRFYKEDSDSYILHTFPDILEDLVKNPRSGTIQCNFDPGTTQSVDNMIKEHPDWCSGLWSSEWNEFLKTKFTTEAPLPSWTELALERMMDSWVATRRPGSTGRESPDFFSLPFYENESDEEGDAGEDGDDDDDDDDDDDENSDWVWDGSDYESE